QPRQPRGTRGCPPAVSPRGIADRSADRRRAARRHPGGTSGRLSYRVVPARLPRRDDRRRRAGDRRPAAGPARTGMRGAARNAAAGGGEFMNAPTPVRAGRAALPAVDRVLRAAGAAALIECHGRTLVVGIVRDTLAEHRSRGGGASAEAILAACAEQLAK